MIAISASDQFCAGDLVEFKSLDEMIEEYGEDCEGMPKVQFGFSRNMTYLCGQVFHIKEIIGNCRVISEEGVENFRTGFTNSWSISTDMIKPYVEPDNVIDVSAWESVLSE